MAGPSSSIKINELPHHDAQSLRRAGRHIVPPFTLSIHSKDGIRELVCHEILRNLPRKRLVCFCTWQDSEEVVAKIYLDPDRGHRHVTREIRGIRYLETAQISTPSILFQGTLSDSSAPALLLCKVHEAKDLRMYDVSDGHVNNEGDHPIERVIEAIAHMHAAGLIQRDIHPGNFLLTTQDIHVIDGADIRKHWHSPLPPQPSIDNIAHFLSQFFSEDDTSLQMFFDYYCRCRNWQQTPRMKKRVTKAIRQWTDWREKKYLQKTLRSCTDFRARKEWRSLTVCNRAWHNDRRQSLLDEPEQTIAGGTIIKDGNTATVVRTTFGNQQLVVKRYNLKNPWHRLRRAIRPTRAMVSWRNANRLRFIGVSTPQPLAVIEERWGPLRGRAYFISAYLAGQPINEVIQQNLSDIDVLNNCADLVLRILQQFCRLRLSHSDLKASNLIVAQDQLFIIDLDGMKKHTSNRKFQHAFRRDIIRLLQNWRCGTIFHTLLKTRIREVFPNV